MPDRHPLFPRSSGVLLHPTSLPGPDGSGDLGTAAFRFVDWLASSGQSLWQILPLGPTSYGDSPYQTLSALAGNPLLISLDYLVADNLLGAVDVAERPEFPAERVDFGPVINWRFSRLDVAWQRFQLPALAERRAEFEQWCIEQSAWLDDFALFMALKDENQGNPWPLWPDELVAREPEALAAAGKRLADAVGSHQFRQWLFAKQWADLHRYATEHGVRLMGDIPIFVAHDSCDVWSHADLFQLDAKGNPTSVAGVPPDYFSETGQLWGNPLYDWARLKETDYQWWADRLAACLATVDLVRIDHFRGFESYWEVPAEEKTAINGQWVKGPGREFFSAMAKALGGNLPIVAEDLGVITPEVEKLRDDVGLPGMKVLQFAWSGPDNAFLPHEHPRHAVIYSGTHDNDPTLGWWKHLADAETRALVSEYVGYEVHEPHWTLIRLGMMSPAHTFIATMQDVLGLGREGRMNLPGEGTGNWNWRMDASAFDNPAGERLARLTWLYRRRIDQSAAAVVEPEPTWKNNP